MVKFGDIWMAPKQGTDAALAMAMGHVILKEFHLAASLIISAAMSNNIPTCLCWYVCSA
jgi:nitrate reductase alpha subunit